MWIATYCGILRHMASKRLDLTEQEELARRTLDLLVARVMHQAGAKRAAGDGRSGHALRHTCAQDLVDGGVDIRVVQRILRHVSIVTTQTYVRGEVNGLREAINGRSYVRVSR